MTIPLSAARLTRRRLRQAQEGDAAAFEQLIDAHLPTLYRTCLGCLGGNEAEAADAVQEALVSAWRNLKSLENPNHFKTWLVRICINACNDTHRRRHAHAALDTVEECHLTEPTTIDGPLEAQEGFRELLTLAGPANSPVIALYYGEGYTTDEIAQLLDLDPAAVRQRLSRGRKAIAQALSDGETGTTWAPGAAPALNAAPETHPHQPRAPEGRTHAIRSHHPSIL